MAAATFLQKRRIAAANTLSTQALLPVSILKPLRGTDPEMYESFRSHCLQDYPEYEIVFGVNDPADSAIAFVQRLEKEFPDRAIKLVICTERRGANTKVSTLAQMLPKANYPLIVVNDSDIRIEPDYLRAVLASLGDPDVGLVTCLYRGVPHSTLGSHLESLGISTDFCPGVLAAHQLEGGIRFGLGSTLAFRKKDLQEIGGFESFADYLADDYQLGSRIAALGREVRLSTVVVETFLPPYSLREFVDHQLRWSRAIRDSRPWGYLGLIFTFGIPWALLTVVTARWTAAVWALFALTVGARLLMATVIGGKVLEDRQVGRWLWLVPLRDLIAAILWMVSLFGRTIVWRGKKFRLKSGKLAAP
ncbi:MAG: bacteriohopanetetrol glucosamine biosynthesis glycosyltransferase HpnI [Acidobacteriales bacterium]|nr:bacteriohopanetetrol glucosamine biosynthesis glycosyltransferase HpnI [Terriglobales bacterium]